MQVKNEENLKFVRRVDSLQVALGKSKAETLAIIGISQAMLSHIRTGKNGVTVKAWAKLEAAERKSGIRPKDGEALRIEEVSGPAQMPEPAKIEPHIARAREILFNLGHPVPEPEDFHEYINTLIQSPKYCKKQPPFLLCLWDELFRVAENLEKMRNPD